MVSQRHKDVQASKRVYSYTVNQEQLPHPLAYYSTALMVLSYFSFVCSSCNARWALYAPTSYPVSQCKDCKTQCTGFPVAAKFVCNNCQCEFFAKTGLDLEGKKSCFRCGTECIPWNLKNSAFSLLKSFTGVSFAPLDGIPRQTAQVSTAYALSGRTQSALFSDKGWSLEFPSDTSYKISLMKIHPSSRLCLDGPFVMPEDIMRVSPVILHVFHQPLDPNLEFRSGVTLGIDCDVDFTLEEDELLFLLTAPQEPVINARCQLEYCFVQLVPATTGKSGAKHGMITAITSKVIPASKNETSKSLQQYHSRKPTPQKLHLL